jgi:hypothetical protein
MHLDILKACSLQVGPLGSCGLIHGKGEDILFSPPKVLFVVPRLLFSEDWQLCPWEQSTLGVRLINYLHLVPGLRRSGVIPPLLCMPLRYTWEILPSVMNVLKHYFI